MNFKKPMKHLFATMGERLSVDIGTERFYTWAIVQPLRYKNKMYLEAERNEIGLRDGECFLYLGPADCDFSGRESETMVNAANRRYNVSRASRISIGGASQYIWAILTPRIKDGEYNELF